MKAFKTYILFAVCAMVLSAAAARAEGEITFPELKDAKLVQEDWYASYAEGKKIGYSNVRISEVKFNGEDCLLFERTEVCEITVGDKALRREASDRALVIKADFFPVYCSSTMNALACKLSETARFERKKEGQKVIITTILNDKTATQTVNFPSETIFYAEVSLPYYYAQNILKGKEGAEFMVFSFIKKAADFVVYEYMGERTEGKGDKARTFRLVETGLLTAWYGPEGKIERTGTADNLFAEILADEKTAKDSASKWDGYKAPDSLDGDMLTVKSAGVKIKRPAPQYFFVTQFESNVFAIMDYTNELAVVGVFLPGIPKEAEHKEAIEKMKGLGTGCKFGEGKIIEVGKQKCLSGEMTRGAGLEAGGGKYYLFIHDDRILFLMAGGKEGAFAAAEKDILKCLESIEFVKPVYDESKLLVDDKVLGMQFKLPHAGWTATAAYPGGYLPTTMENFWRGVEIQVERAPLEVSGSIDQIIEDFAGPSTIINKGEVEMDGCTATYVDYKYPWTTGGKDKKNEVQPMIRLVVIPRGASFDVIQILVPKSEWEKALPEIESIIKSIKFTEPKPKP